jgi:hypothetical protein
MALTDINIPEGVSFQGGKNEIGSSGEGAFREQSDE